MEPVRTCVGCRQQASRSELLRLTLQNQILQVDEKAVNSGRGAWLHANRECLLLAVNRKSFNRGFRKSQEIDVSALAKYIEQAEMMLANK